MQCIRCSVVCLCVCVCLSVGHKREPCKSGWTDRDAIWVVDSDGPQETCIRSWSRSPGKFVHKAVRPFVKLLWPLAIFSQRFLHVRGSRWRGGGQRRETRRAGCSRIQHVCQTGQRGGRDAGQTEHQQGRTDITHDRCRWRDAHQHRRRRRRQGHGQRPGVVHRPRHAVRWEKPRTERSLTRLMSCICTIGPTAACDRRWL